MSTPTSRTAVAVAAALALSGCVEGLVAPAPRAVAVAGGAVTVAGPSGYCVDRRATRDGPDEAFVVLASCAALSGGGAAPQGVPAILTATVSGARAAALPAPREVEAFLRSAPGLAATARSGRAGDVEVLNSEVRGDVLLLQIRDAGAPAAEPAMSGTYWRAVFGVGGRLVTATVTPFADRPLSPEAGLGLLTDFVARLRAGAGGSPA